MMDKEKMNEAVKHLGELTDEQKKILEGAQKNPVSEKELFEKLGVDIDSFAAFMKEAITEEEVFSQEVSAEELSYVAGGKSYPGLCDSAVNINCARSNYYRIYDNSFPNCNATVEDGSWCYESDACYGNAITYVDLKECAKAWK